MRSLIAVLFVFAALAAVHCGGRVIGVNPDGGVCDLNAACAEGWQCTYETNVCQQTTTVTCTCSQGTWACPDTSGTCPVDTCPMDIYPGDSCSLKGQQCEAMVKPTCVDFPIMCTCDGHQFQCPIPDCPVEAAPLCPPPDQIVPNTGCTVPGYEVCPGPNSSECTCAGNWQCSYPVDGGVVDASWGTD